MADLTNPFLQSPYQAIIDSANEPKPLPGSQSVKDVPLPTIPSAKGDEEDDAPAPAPAADPQSLLPPPELRPMFETVASHFNVPVNVLMALAHQESSYNASAKNASGASGMAQYMPATAKSLGINPDDPNEAIPAMAQQLRKRLDKGYSMADAVKEHFAGTDRKGWGNKTAAYGDQVLAKAGSIGQELYGDDSQPDAPAQDATAQPAAPDTDTDTAQNQFAPTRMRRDDYLAEFKKLNPKAPQAAIDAVMAQYDKQIVDAGAARAKAKTIGPDAIKTPEQFFDDRLNARLQGPANGIVPQLLGRMQPDELQNVGTEHDPSTLDTVGGNAIGGLMGTIVGAVAANAHLIGADDVAKDWASGLEQIKGRQKELGGDTFAGKTASLVGGIVPAMVAAPESKVVEFATNSGLFGVPAFQETYKAKVAEGQSNKLALVHAFESFGMNTLMPTLMTKGTGAIVGKLGSEGAAGIKGAALGLGQAAGEGVGFSAANSVMDKGTDAIAGQQNDRPWLDPEDMAVQAAGFGAIRGAHMAPHVAEAVLDKAAPSFQVGRALAGDVADANFDPSTAQAAAAARLSPDTYDPTAITPQETARATTDVGPSPMTRTVSAPADMPQQDAQGRIEPTIGAEPAPPAGPLTAALDDVTKRAATSTGNPVVDQMLAIRPMDTPPAGPLESALTDAAAAHAANPAPMPEQPAAAPQPPDYSTMSRDELKARMQDAAQRIKAATDPAQRKAIQQERDTIEREIGARGKQAVADSKPAVEPLNAGPFDNVGAANKMMTRFAAETGQPHEVVKQGEQFIVKPMGEVSNGIDAAGLGRGTDGRGRSSEPAGRLGSDQRTGRGPAEPGVVEGGKTQLGQPAEAGVRNAGDHPVAANGAANHDASLTTEIAHVPERQEVPEEAPLASGAESAPQADTARAAKPRTTLADAKVRIARQEEAVRVAAENLARRKAEKTSGDRMRERVQSENPFMAFLATHGIHMDERSDTGGQGGKAGIVMVPGYGALYRKSGERMDELASLAHDAGFLSDADMADPTDNGGTRKLAEMIARAVHGKEVIKHAADVAPAESNPDHELFAEAAKLGIETEGKSADQVYDEVASHHAARFDDEQARIAVEMARDADIPLDGGEAAPDHLTDEKLDEIFPTAGSRNQGEDARDSAEPAHAGAEETGGTRESATGAEGSDGTESGRSGAEPADTGDATSVSERKDDPYTRDLFGGQDLFDHIDTRPGTLLAQKAVGRAAISDLARRLGIDRIDRNNPEAGSSVSVLGSRLLANFVEGKPNQLVGQHVKSTHDLAVLAQVYRDPRFETFRVFYVGKGGEVVGESGYTSRMAAAVHMPNDLFQQIAHDKARFGAQGYYLLHNHPSGHSEPSPADVNMTRHVDQNVPGMLGHVVIDHSEYSVIHGVGHPKTIDAPHLNGKDFTGMPEMEHALLGVKLTDPDAVARAAKALQVPDGHATLILTTARGETQLLVDVPMGAVSDLKTGDDFTRAKAMIRRMTREAGAGGHRFLVLPDSADIKSTVFLKALAHGMVTDVVNAKGESLQNKGFYFGGDFVAKGRPKVLRTNEGKEVAEPTGDYGDRPIDEDTGLPLNEDGTVTVYHHTSSENADRIRKTGMLKSAGEPDVYVTTHADTDTGYGDTAVPIKVDPSKLQIDDEFPNGRRDFRIDTGRPGGSIRVKVDDAPPSVAEPVDQYGDRRTEDRDTPDRRIHTVQVDGQRRPIENSRGQLIAPDAHQQMNFWRWAKDTKIVDDQGRPLVMYHGTGHTDIDQFLPHGFGKDEVQKTLDQFLKAKGANERYGYLNFRGGSFFSPKPEYAGNYVGENSGTVYPVYIKAENPVYVDMVTRKAHGIDASKTPDALIMHINGDIQEVAIIDPKQVKSAIGNNGQYDPANPSIVAEQQAGYGAGDSREPEPIPDSTRTKLGQLIARPVNQLKSAAHTATMLVSPMDAGSSKAQAWAKDFANSTRRAQEQWKALDTVLKKNFNDADLRKMWQAADEENDLRREGKTADDKGLNALPKDQREVVDLLHAYGEQLWQRAKNAGLVDPEAEGVHYWTPRMAARVVEDGNVEALRQSAGDFGKDAKNLRTSANSTKQRKYETTAESEEALKAKLGDDATYVKNIRVMPLAMSQLEKAIAGRTLVNQVKAHGQLTGDDLVRDTETKGFETFNHPALTRMVPRMKDGKVVLDSEGNAVIDKMPLFVRKDFVGPLKAVLNSSLGAKAIDDTYRGLMQLKGASMSVIMASPMTHNAVIWGKAMPSLITSMGWKRNLLNAGTAGGYTYYMGHQWRQDRALMNDLVDGGLVPMGGRGMNPDIEDIGNGLKPGKSLLAKALGRVLDVASPKAGDAARKAVDAAGHFWHETLLWNRIGDMQVGMAVQIRNHLMDKGVDQYVATRIATHFANRYAGAIPQEALSQHAHALLNTLLFSKSFTGTNLGAMKDPIAGLPQDVRAQIREHFAAVNRAMGKTDIEAYDEAGKVVKQAQSITRSKARSILLADFAAMAAITTVTQAFLKGQTGQQFLDDLKKRAQKLGVKLDHDNPLSFLGPTWGKMGLPLAALRHPFDNLEALSQTSDNPHGKQDRIRIGQDEHGNSYYMRLPVGKVVEEMKSYLNLSSTRDLLEAKASPLVKGMAESFNNKDFYGRSVYNDTDNLMVQVAKAVGHVAKSLVPYDDLVAAKNLAAGSASQPGDKVHVMGKDMNMDQAKLLGTATGLSVSKLTGGDAVAEMRYENRQLQQKLNNVLPDVKDAVQHGKIEDAAKMLQEAGQTPQEISRTIRQIMMPGAITKGRLNRFMQHADPDQVERVTNMMQQK